MSVLDQIVADARSDADERQQRVSLAKVQKAAAKRSPALPISMEWGSPQSDHVHVIAEVKRASPSKGDLADIGDPAALAADYARGGASAISVLTEPRRFKGSLDDLRAVAEAARIPVLRKDFLVTEYQIWESRAAGADVVLLIVAALPPKMLQTLFNLTNELGMTALVEAHDEAETKQAVDLGAQVIGINSRNLHTLAVDPKAFSKFARFIPADRYRVAESGISEPEHVTDAGRHGASAVLVGESLVTCDAPSDAVSALVSAGRGARVTS